MKNISKMIALVLLSSSAFAASPSMFAGQYSLQNETLVGSNQQQICSESLQIAINGKSVRVISASFDATAEVNGQPVKLVDSTKPGQFQVGYANNQLTISITGFLPDYMTPVKTEYSETIVLEQAASELNVRHTLSSSLPALNADSQCVYVKN